MANCVGVLDSGVGGLTVLNELRKVAPACNFLYFADEAFCPYGERTFAEIRQRVLTVSNFLQRSGASEIVLACNTASVFVNDVKMQTKIPIYDVVSPTCQVVRRLNSCGKVVLLATKATVKSGIYSRLLGQNTRLISIACGEFVDLLENDRPPQIRRETVKERLKMLKRIRPDTVILGCTHFPLLLDEISPCVCGAQVVSCDKPVADLFGQTNTFYGDGNIQLLSSGDLQTANKVAQHFELGQFSFQKL